jgi:hypothetical protein
MSEFYEAVRLKMKVPPPRELSPPEKKKNWCWPWSHEWTKWETIETGCVSVVDRITTKPLAITGSFEKQRRVCENCGMSDLRKVIT